MNNSESQIAATCLGMLLNDESWQDFGFAKRPRYGAIFERFRSSWKVSLEKKILKEMLTVFTAAYVAADRLTVDGVSNVITAYVKNPDVVQALGYSSREDAICDLTQAINTYINLPIMGWSHELARKIDYSSIPDKKFSARTLVGCIRFSQNIEGMILMLAKVNRIS